MAKTARRAGATKRPRRRAAPPATASERYWDRRVGSREFAAELTALAVRELGALARERVGDIVDPELVRTLIRELDTRVLDRAIAAELAVDGARAIRARLAREQRSFLDLAGPRLLEEIDAALEARRALPAQAEAFITALMEQEFVRSLFTDIIYTAIVSFYQRVNPLFGALATSALEDQIKGFIRLFMPIVQAQAVAFAIDRRNQRIVLGFARAVIRLLLEMPLARFAALARAADDTQTAGLIRKAVHDARLASVTRDAAAAMWDDFYAAVRRRRIGELLRLEQQADWLAARAVAVLLPVLRRPHVRRFIAREIERAARE